MTPLNLVFVMLILKLTMAAACVACLIGIGAYLRDFRDPADDLVIFIFFLLVCGALLFGMEFYWLLNLPVTGV